LHILPRIILMRSFYPNCFSNSFIFHNLFLALFPLTVAAVFSTWFHLLAVVVAEGFGCHCGHQEEEDDGQGDDEGDDPGGSGGAGGAGVAPGALWPVYSSTPALVALT